MVQRPHVVDAVGEFHEDDADVIHHRQQHLPEVFGLPLFGGLERDGADLRDALDDVRHLRPEAFGDDLDGGERVLDDIVQEPCGNRDNVELQVRQEIGNLERMNHVRLTGMPHLSLVLERGEDVRPAQQLEIGIRAVGANLLEEILEANHGTRCLNPVWRCDSSHHRTADWTTAQTGVCVA